MKSGRNLRDKKHFKIKMSGDSTSSLKMQFSKTVKSSSQFSLKYSGKIFWEASGHETPRTSCDQHSLTEGFVSQKLILIPTRFPPLYFVYSLLSAAFPVCNSHFLPAHGIRAWQHHGLAALGWALIKSGQGQPGGC